MIPQTFEEWKSCMANDCKIELNRDFAQRRLAVDSDDQNQETQKFVSLYGKQHLNKIINWLSKI